MSRKPKDAQTVGRMTVEFTPEDREALQERLHAGLARLLKVSGMTTSWFAQRIDAQESTVIEWTQRKHSPRGVLLARAWREARLLEARQRQAAEFFRLPNGTRFRFSDFRIGVKGLDK